MNRRVVFIIVMCLLLAGGLLAAFNLSPQLRIREAIRLIAVRNGTTGDLIEIRDQQEIRRIIDSIHELGLKRLRTVPPSTGWSIMLELYEQDSERVIRLVLRDNGIQYRNSYYGTNEQVGDMLNAFVAMFESQRADQEDGLTRIDG